MGQGNKRLAPPPGETALGSPCLAGSYEEIASAKPPLVKEITIRMPRTTNQLGPLVKTETRTVGYAMAPTDGTQKMEAASAQAVKRGPPVTMIEIPDQDDDMSFIMNRKAKLTPTIEVTVTSPTVVEPSRVDTKAEKVLHEWLKPFGAEWTLRGIVDAKTESEAKAILKNWIHKACAEEVIDEMLEGMRKAQWTNALEWLKEL